MAFVTDNGETIAFCDWNDILNLNSRIFRDNPVRDVVFNDGRNVESLPVGSDDFQEWLTMAAVDATAIVTDKIRFDPRWIRTDGEPLLELSRVKVDYPRLVDLTRHVALREFVIPKQLLIGEDSALNVMKYYDAKIGQIFQSLMGNLDWYDLDDDGVVDSDDTRYFVWNGTRNRRVIPRTRVSR